MSYAIEWIWPFVPLGALTLLITPWVGGFVAVLLVLVVALAILVAFVGAIVATPFLLARAVRRRRRSGRTRPAHTGQTTVSKASLPTAAGRHTAAPAAPGALVR